MRPYLNADSKEKMDGSYKVTGYYNRWSIIDTYDKYALLENEIYGDETCLLVVEKDKYEMRKYKNKTGEVFELPTFTEVICETFDDIETALCDAGII